MKLKKHAAKMKNEHDGDDQLINEINIPAKETKTTKHLMRDASRVRQIAQTASNRPRISNDTE